MSSAGRLTSDMHEYASERRQQAERIQGLGTMFGMREVGRKRQIVFPRRRRSGNRSGPVRDRRPRQRLSKEPEGRAQR